MALLLCVLAAATGSAQRFEIRTTNRGLGLIGVEMRVTSGAALTTADAITDIVFGIKWSSSYNVDLSSTFSTVYNIRRSGTRTLKSGFHFQAFYAESVPFSIPANWVVNSWTEIMTISNDRTGSGTGLFEIVETGFDPATDPNIGINLVDNTPVIAGRATEILLPVTLASFQAMPANKSVRLQWVTENEQNSKGFEVQRADGNTVFNKVGWVDSKFKSAGKNQYEFIDKDVAEQTKYFYRIKQVDNDGQSVYSGSKTVLLNGTSGAPVSILPNPVTETLQVLINDPVNAAIALQIIDGKGAVVQTRKESVRAGQKIALNTANLTPGHYYLVIQQQDGSILFSKAFQKR